MVSFANKDSQSLRMCILGGGGYLGSCLTEKLQKDGHFVVVLDLNFENLPQIIFDEFRLKRIKGSILNPVILAQALKECDACFHLVGYGIFGSASAFVLAEIALRNPDSVANGNIYHIVDAGPPVHPFFFWNPLISYLNPNLTNHQIPFWLAHSITYCMEMLYKVCGVEPLMTRMDASALSTHRTFSIQKAVDHLGYQPVNNHCLEATIEHFEKYGKHAN
uniref:NAD-dependent epimerase/dehydratase domain-containing protein n=1 Tax=Ditylenchus dipsaci TaxID=166011 RepID=A0A915EQL4_9BILA